MKIEFIDFIARFSRFGYIIVATISIIIGFYFIFDAIYYNSFISGVISYFFMFIVGYCWNKDSERKIIK
jgi:hypothetical protein